MAELFLIRHGQASFGSDDYDQLSSLGIEQSRLLGRYFYQRGPVFDKFFSGEMKRHKQTLAGICKGLGLGETNPYEVHSGLNEYDFDSMVKLYRQTYPADKFIQSVKTNPSDKKAYYRLLRQVLQAWSKGKLEQAPETWPAFQQRVHDARAMLQQVSTTASRLLVISSGGAISQFIGSVLGLTAEKIFDLNLQLYNASISHFYLNKSKVNLAVFNALPHLDDPDRTDLITYG